MIYHVTLTVTAKGNITDVVPRSFRHLLKIIESSRGAYSLIKQRTMVGWLNQKQFDKLVHDCFLKVYESANVVKNDSGMVKMERRIPALDFSYAAVVQPYPQKYKRTGRVSHPPTPMEFKSYKQMLRIKRWMEKRYA